MTPMSDNMNQQTLDDLRLTDMQTCIDPTSWNLHNHQGLLEPKTKQPREQACPQNGCNRATKWLQ